jgi:hypothetical protein
MEGGVTVGRLTVGVKTCSVGMVGRGLDTVGDGMISEVGWEVGFPNSESVHPVATTNRQAENIKEGIFFMSSSPWSGHVHI